MQLFDTVTFGPSGLDRAAHLRSGEIFDDARRDKSAAHSIVMWRGKALLADGEMRDLMRIPLDHAIADRADSVLFLGQEDTGLCFALDISSWAPSVDMDAGFVDQSEQTHPDLSGGCFADLRANMTRLTSRDAELASTAKALLAWHSSHRFCAACGQPSDMVQMGWQRSCAACGTQHFPRTDPVVIMLITRGDKVLMGRSPGWPEGMYSLLAGFVEPGETPEAAVRRETLEEAGIEVGRVDYLGSQPWAFPNSLMMGFRGEALNDDITIDPNEIEDAIWVPREEIMQGLSGHHPVLQPARKGAIAEFILRNWVADRLG